VICQSKIMCSDFFFIFSATFSNISAISWWRKPDYQERTTDHGQATGKLYHLHMYSVILSLIQSLGVPAFY